MSQQSEEVNRGGETAQRFEIVRENRRQYRRFNTQGTQLTVRLNPPSSSDIDPIDHFTASMNDLFEHALRGVGDGDMVGIAIHNETNQTDKPIGISFRRRDQLSVDAIWSVLEKVTQSNARFNALDTLTVVVHSVTMPVGFGRQPCGIKTMGRPISVMAHLKTSIVRVKSETNCLAHALIIAVARATKDPNYKAYTMGRKIYPRVDQLLVTTGINLDNGGGIPELERFQEHFRHYKIVVYTGLNCDDIMFEGRVDAVERLNLLYDEVTRHYHVIGNLTAAMAKRYVCTACGTGCRRDVTHTCDQTCSSCMASPPCVATGVRIPCADCARHFRSQICFANHKRRIGNRRAVCERKRECVTCGELIVSDKPHECGKRYCDVCTANREAGHLCYMQPLKNVLPSSDGVLYVFFDFETTQNTRYSETTKEHVPNLA